MTTLVRRLKKRALNVGEIAVITLYCRQVLGYMLLTFVKMGPPPREALIITH